MTINLRANKIVYFEKHCLLKKLRLDIQEVWIGARIRIGASCVVFASPPGAIREIAHLRLNVLNEVLASTRGRKYDR